MALETRGGNLYYYRSVRDGEAVRKIYIGAGEIARISHESDRLRRTAQEAEREKQQAELERLKALAAPVLELSEAAEILAQAHLVAAGYRRYQGKWRRVRST
jgi:crotonobetainyl-CoA:carnitine CoA-transferase CaiB-like acyl-CoA transferase